jgi:hypothetical protein
MAQRWRVAYGHPESEAGNAGIDQRLQGICLSGVGPAY